MVFQSMFEISMPMSEAVAQAGHYAGYHHKAGVGGVADNHAVGIERYVGLNVHIDTMVEVISELYSAFKHKARK